MQRAMEIDRFDLKLLAALQDDARLTNHELGERVGLSPSQCSRRRARLEETGLIRGYRAELSAEDLGFAVLVFVEVTLASHSGDNARRFRDLVNRIDEVQEAYAMTGSSDYLLKIVLPDLKSLSEIVNNVLLPHESIAHVRSAVVLDRLKAVSRIPLPV